MSGTKMSGWSMEMPEIEYSMRVCSNRIQDLEDAMRLICAAVGVSFAECGNDHERASREFMKALERNYIPSPTCDDGEAIEVGDELCWYGRHVSADSLVWDGKDWYVREGVISSSMTYLARACRHRERRRALEDVLRDFTDAVFRWDAEGGTVAEKDTWSELARPYAAEIRELLEADGGQG